jgi:hypothetical protein
MPRSSRDWRDSTVLESSQPTRLTNCYDGFARLNVRRVPIGGAPLDTASWMRDNIAARDALYVAAARELGCGLLTTDQRLARAVPDLATGPTGKRSLRTIDRGALADAGAPPDRARTCCAAIDGIVGPRSDAGAAADGAELREPYVDHRRGSRAALRLE